MTVDTSAAMLARVIAAAVLLAAALAAPAAAAELDPLKACYVSAGDERAQRETIHVHATGFTPGSTVDMTIDGQPAADPGVADQSGETTADVPAPFQGRGERPFTLVVAERDNPANFVTATPLVTDLTVTLRPNPARPSQRVRFRGRGFTSPAPVYAHYLFRGKLQKTVRLARQTTGPCGQFSVKRRQIPVRSARTGRWLLQVDQQRRWSKTPASNMQQIVITVTETFREP
jgi:hypothetical protein